MNYEFSMQYITRLDVGESVCVDELDALGRKSFQLIAAGECLRTDTADAFGCR